MITRCHGRLLRSVSVILGMCAAGLGCQSLEGPGAGGASATGALGRAGEAGASTSGVITPQAFVYWSIQATDGLPNKLMTGQSLVSPEGMMELGPWTRIYRVRMEPYASASVDQCCVAAKPRRFRSCRRDGTEIRPLGP